MPPFPVCREGKKRRSGSRRSLLCAGYQIVLSIDVRLTALTGKQAAQKIRRFAHAVMPVPIGPLGHGVSVHLQQVDFRDIFLALIENIAEIWYSKCKRSSVDGA